MKEGETIKIKARDGSIVEVNISEEECKEFKTFLGEKRRHPQFGEATVLGVGPATDPLIDQKVVWYILNKEQRASYNVLFKAEDWQKVS